MLFINETAINDFRQRDSIKVKVLNRELWNEFSDANKPKTR